MKEKSKKKNVDIIAIILANDVIEQILLKLPLNSLLNSRGVCKHWKCLIESPRFNDCYHNPPQQLEKEGSSCNDKTLVSIISNRQIYTIDLKELQIGRSSLNIKDYYKTRNRCSSSKCDNTGSVGTCNGMLCFTENTIVLYNPSTNVNHIVPIQPKSYYCVPIPKGHIVDAMCGFGYDYTTYDYKVVLVVWISTSPFLTQTCHQAHVYSSKTKSWKPIQGFPMGTLSVEQCSDYYVFVNNSLHWLLDQSGGILRFDLSSETFSLLPWHTQWDCGPGVFLNMVEGCLSAWFRRGNEIEIWIMKTYGVQESCWTKLLNIQTDVEAVTLIAFSKDWDRLLLAEFPTEITQNTRFCWYDVHTSGRIWEIEVQNTNQDNIYEVETSMQSRLTLDPIKIKKKRRKRKRIC
ncbi:hypothetical protein SOVF_007640 [Spinacia oleracea]|uniref:F-box/kelch-repeat protein At3g23880-like n=1 Tax=Spinacia oleracea TaxID=3562 RepID=A0A9R0JR67_SPIOL|nr:F-box/kelch-repeat protein At3g23880-like [Spinacia oleracea]KNA25319.1 hypothetical protein SOVF_007640 [Spinacia oleracea]